MRGEGAHRCEDRHDIFGVFGGLDHSPVASQANAGLDAVEAHGHGLLDAFGGGFRRVAPGGAIHADTVTRRAAQETIDRDAQPLASDVPKCLLDTGQGAGEDLAATVEAVLVDALPVVDDLGRILPNQPGFHLLDRGLAGEGAALEDWFTEARHAFVGVDTQEQPTWFDKERLETRDLHRRVPSFRCRARTPVGILARMGDRVPAWLRQPRRVGVRATSTYCLFGAGQCRGTGEAISTGS